MKKICGPLETDWSGLGKAQMRLLIPQSICAMAFGLEEAKQANGLHYVMYRSLKDAKCNVQVPSFFHVLS